MSERGQKIFKWIVWTAIIVFVVFEVTKFLVELGVIELDMLPFVNSEQEDTDEILLNELELYYSPESYLESYPEYFELESKVDVVNTDRWEITGYNQDNNTVYAVIEGSVPEVGTIMLLPNEYGITQGKYVEQIVETDAGEYAIQVSEVSDISEVFDTISFSGTSDFRYLAGQIDTRETTDSKLTTLISGLENLFLLPVYAVEIKRMFLEIEEWVEDQQHVSRNEYNQYSNESRLCDIQFHTKINGGEQASTTSYISVTSDSATETYQYGVDGNGRTAFLEDDWSDFDKSEYDNISSIAPYTHEELGVIANVTFMNFGVCASGYFQMDEPENPNNYVEVLLSADQIIIELSGKLNSQGIYKIGTIPIPIQSTAGIISVTLSVNLVVDAEGEVTLWCSMDNPHFGMSVSVAEGATPLCGWSHQDVGVHAKIDIEGGFLSEVAVVALDTITLANPVVDARVVASAASFEMSDFYKLKGEYEEICCMELKVQAPIVTMHPSTDEHSILYTLLETIGAESSYNLVEQDSDSELLKKLTYHIEHEQDESVTFIIVEEGEKHEDVCTHIEIKSTEELELEGKSLDDLEFVGMFDGAGDKLDETIDDAMGKFGQMLESMAQTWFEENCLGCFY